MKSVQDKILSRIQRFGRGQAFSTKDFLDLATRTSVDNALSALAKQSVIRRVTRGIYDYPRVNPKLGGILSPDYDAVAQAIARKNAIRLQPSGAWAANRLGLSTQVPAKIIYLTNGDSRTYKVGTHTLQFKRVSPKDLGPKNGISGLVIQALRYLGKARVNAATIANVKDRLSESDRKTLLRETRYSSDWIYETAKLIAQERQDR